jgi:hypothetical protein
MRVIGLSALTIPELLMLLQTLILFGTGIVVFFYTLETRKMRTVANAQFRIMQETFKLQLEDQQRAAEPIFVWGGGSANMNHVQWEFRDEGGPISNLTISMRSPTGAPVNLQPDITPKEWLGTSREGTVCFDGETTSQLSFMIGFRTRIGAWAPFFSWQREQRSQPTRGVGGFKPWSAERKHDGKPIRVQFCFCR